MRKFKVGDKVWLYCADGVYRKYIIRKKECRSHRPYLLEDLDKGYVRLANEADLIALDELDGGFPRLLRGVEVKKAKSETIQQKLKDYWNNKDGELILLWIWIMMLMSIIIKALFGGGCGE